MPNAVNGHDKTGPALKGCAHKAIDIADAELQFREAASQRGLKLPLKLAADGKIHRCGTEDEPRGSDGSYILHLDDIPAGGFRNWKDGVPWQNWCADIGRELTRAERDGLAGRVEKGRRQQETEEARRNKEAAKRAAGIWNSAKPAPADHPYLVKKGVGAHGLRLHAGNGVLAGIANGGDADCTVTVDVIAPEPAPLAASRFTIEAPELVRLGYSPIPRLVRNGEGRPAIKGWSDYCSRQPTQSEIGVWSKIAGADIALCMGFNGAIAIDVDTNEPEILDAVRCALRYCGVARFGSKGFALLGRHADGPQRSFTIYSSDKARKGPLIEVMGTGRNITIPPSIHAKTGRAYQWIDPENGEVSADGLPRLSELPIITGEDLERLRQAVAPWAAKPREPKPRPAVPGVKPSGKRLQAYAQKGLENIEAELASASAGRNNALFSGVCSIGWAVHHRVLSERAVTDALLSACGRNGALADHGRNACIATIDSGLSKSAGDDLPVLEEREQQGTATVIQLEARGFPAQFAAIPREVLFGEPQPLPDGLPPVTAFDFDLLPDPVRPWAEDIVETMQAPADFAGVTVMAGLGTVLGRKIGIRPQQNTGWTETANQWALVIGRPGILKSPTIEACLAPVKALAAAAIADFKKQAHDHGIADKIAKMRAEAMEAQAKKAIRKDINAPVNGYFELGGDSAGDDPQPVLHRYISNDPSPAALGQLLIENPNGLLVYRDEIVSLLQSFEREGNEEGRGFYLTGWSGTSAYTFDRIVRGMNLHIPAVCISMLGSTQPGKIAGYLASAVRGGAGDDGLIQRFGLMVWPDISSQWEDVDRPLRAESKRAAFQVFKTLDTMDPIDRGAKQDVGFDGEPENIPYLRFDDDAQVLFRSWRGDLERRLRSGEMHPAMESHLAKYRKLVPSLALITHLANSGRGPVGITAAMTALAWAEYLETHAKRAYASVTMPAVDAAKAIVARIKSGALGKVKASGTAKCFTRRDILQAEWSRLTDQEAVQKALDLLVDLDWLSSTTENTGGRPKTTYAVNPKVQP